MMSRARAPPTSGWAASVAVLLLTVLDASRADRDQYTACGNTVGVRSIESSNGTLLQRQYRVDSYQCPTNAHTDAETACCQDPPKYRCCTEPTAFGLPSAAVQWLLIVVSVAAIAVLGSVLILCLCNEKCALHKLVRRRPKTDYIAYPDETANLSGTAMPTEDGPNSRTYVVNPEIIYRKNPDAM